MSKRQFKSQASSGRAGTVAGFGGSTFGAGSSSILSYVQEPPDYSNLANANNVVAFKNLSKKDETTKAKAIEDLQNYIHPPDLDIDEAFLEAWTRLFPRLSIDNSRRVRQLAHTLNGHVCVKSGKRTARHMPRIAGPWLAGTFDSDRTVSRAATDALDLVFSNPEKIQGVRKAFQGSILEYCRESALHETVQTLSDERIVSSDDAQATYGRVVANSLSLVGSLIRELDPESIEKELKLYEDIFSDARLWDFASHSDAGVKRSMHRLVNTCLDKRPALLQGQAQVISHAYVYKGLQADQTGSALGFVHTLESLTAVLPQIWTDAYHGKKPVVTRLRHFLKQGSQSASLEFWKSLERLLREIPKAVLPKDADGISGLLSALHLGVTKKEERLNSTVAWPTYFTFADILTSNLSQTEADPVLDSHVMPVVRQYIKPEPETADWAISGAKPAWVVSRILVISKIGILLDHEWPVQTERLIEAMKTSLPEQSKDFEKSQTHVAAFGERWANLQRELWDDEHARRLEQTFVDATSKVLTASIDLLDSRNAKPYGAAAVLEQLLRTCGTHIMQHKSIRETYTAFAEQILPQMVFSPSQRHLIHGLYAISGEPVFSVAFTSLVNAIMDSSEEDAANLRALRVMFTSSTPKEAVQISRNMPRLQEYLVHTFSLAEVEAAGGLFADLIKIGALTDDTSDAILTRLTTNLSLSDVAATALSAMDMLLQSNQALVDSFASKPNGAGSELIPNLLRLEQSPHDEIAERAAALSAKLASSVDGRAAENRFHAVLQNLERVSKASLQIEATIELANRLMGPNPQAVPMLDLIPSIETWTTATRAAIRPPSPPLALLSPLGGVTHFLHRDLHPSEAVQFDADGLSQALRIAIYVIRLFSETDLLNRLGPTKAMIMALIEITVRAAEDNVSLAGTNDLWSLRRGVFGEAAALAFIGDANKVLHEFWSTATADLTDGASPEFPQFSSALGQLRDDLGSSSQMSYYTWLSYSEILANLFELHGFSSAQVKASEDALHQRHSNRDLLPLLATVSGLRQPLSGTPTLNKLFNGIVSDLTDLDIVGNELKALEQLVILNTILHTQEEITVGVPKQRLIFLVKAIVKWTEQTISLPVKAESFKALATLSTGIQEMYGEHWEHMLASVIACWNADLASSEEDAADENNVLLLNASLKLFAALKRLSRSEEPNDDLLDALKDKDAQLRDALVHLLTAANATDDEMNQPLMLTHELLARQLAALPHKPLKEAEEVYPLLYSASRPVMQAGFDLLHRDIPAAQEQISFDAALDNKSAHLPDELLSLILEAPTLDSLADASFDRMMPLALQGYLYSWRLVFDHFNGSSFRVKNDYIEQLKEGGYLTGLLDLTYDFLGHTRGKAVDVSRFDVQEYVPDVEPSPERDVQWLLTHIYFLALTHVPSLVKSYYLDIRSRQTSVAVETWTAKFLSPLIVSASLQDVAEWADKGAKEDPEYEKMSVKVGMRSKEISVGYVVDEQTMAIKVVLPDSYPLASAQVVGVSRVAVKEEKWQSWLRNCQGVITFSNGSIIDGLTAWRKNVTGTLKGQTECAICYSIISADKQLPTKRCPTCKNLFHSSCLLKWFKTSNASTCPLCRNPFNFN